MNLGASLSLLTTVIGDAPAAISFLMASVHAVESRDLSGPDKLTAVLNAGENFIRATMPNLAAELEPIMEAIAHFVNALVELWNETTVFTHAPKFA